MDANLQPTGRTSGITGIPTNTLRRYVREFREFFSEAAQKPTKGRRFTPQDINNLLLIRHLHFEHTSPDRIRAALRGEWVPEATPQYNNQDALTLVQSAKRQMESADDYARQARQAANQAKTVVDSANSLLNRFRKVIEKRLEPPGLDPVSQTRITELESRIAALEKAQREQKQRRGFFGLGG